ncbi:hypothetical protein [Bacterioplanoides sp. SCSIO 12839]|uniref:hypothetical protein n=1 Tax=Bacterioplanoides sp. SCSIO 12839 TaxID=2829569 RepID=UPI0021023308|nr:hypothetical protein [Bacterioplanoides sp. SCSIO 12839]UTW48649.1 hypothetical protein KFF03_01730 [Bacterioplanoides sp. SCSIO 12839]
MEDYQLLILARALHVFGVVIWIGGVAFVTLVLIPALRLQPDEMQRMALFEQLEGRFAAIAKFTTLVTGISGFYLIETLNLWQRYASAEFWWMHAMTLIWLIFSLILFVFEPLFLHRWYHQQAQINSDRTFAVMQKLHWTLLTVSLITVLAAVAGSHGWVF